MTNSTPDSSVLTDETIERIANKKVFQYGTMVSLTVAERDALLNTVKQLRAESLRYKTGFDDYVRKLEADNERLTTGLVNLYHFITNEQCERKVALGMATSAVSSLQSQLEQLRAENERLQIELEKETHIADDYAVEVDNLQTRAVELCKQKAADYERAMRNRQTREAFTKTYADAANEIRKALEAQ